MNGTSDESRGADGANIDLEEYGIWDLEFVTLDLGRGSRDMGRVKAGSNIENPAVGIWNLEFGAWNLLLKNQFDDRCFPFGQ